MSAGSCQLRDEMARQRVVARSRTYRVAVGRALRVQVAGGVFHITSRGNRGQTIYNDDDDRIVFLLMRNRVLQRFGWRQMAYCLMTNHFHLLIQTPEPNLSAGIHRLNGGYAAYFNERHWLAGHLFERRFWSRQVETERDLHGILDYIASNPVRAGLCERPSQWRWSSFYRSLDPRYDR